MYWCKEPFTKAVGFEDMLYNIEPKESKNFRAPVSKLLKNKKLLPGKYRITKRIWAADQKKETFEISAQFEVKYNSY